MKETISFLNNTIKDNDSIVVACSGGPDSMCLLFLACLLKKKKNINVIVAHVNHYLREESKDEKIFVEEYCKKNNVIFEYLGLKQFKKDKFSEQKAHKLRYNFFIDIVKKYNAKYLFTAHHGDDLTETILMRLTRGSNLAGYSGFKRIVKKDNYYIVRPLITATKKEIEEYNKKNNIPYVTDQSNFSDKYTRNRYRMNLLPLLKEEDKQVHLKYLQFSEELNEYDEFINNYVDNLKVINNNLEIDLKLLKKESTFIQRKIIERVIKEIQKVDWLDISNAQVKEIFKLINKDKGTINLNNNYEAINCYNKLIIVKKKEYTNFEYVLNDKVITDDYILKIVKKSSDESNNTIRLNSKEITLPLIVRKRKNGDKIEVKNLNGTKKIKDIFIDEKIDVRKREVIPILTDSNGKVLWIAGIKKSKFCKNKNELYDIIVKCEAR